MRKILCIFLLLIAPVSLTFAKNKNSKIKKEDQELLKEASDYFKPLPDSLIDVKKNKQLINLGKKLYFETKLSINNTISCNSCHKLDQYGVDNEPTSPGHDGRRGDRNSPSVYNAALHFAQFWDGRAKDVEEQALGPILNPIEHGLASEADAVKKLSEAGYLKEFQQAFPQEKEALTYKNIGVAIGAYEKTLLTPSRFDDFLKGKVHALNDVEKRGLKRFMSVGCTSCHNGVAIGGEMYQKLGLVEDYPTKDKGRSLITKNAEDDYFFKVPSLRNVEKTFPYFHDGSLKTLDEVITVMAKHQLGEKLSQQDKDDIKAFLQSLTAKKLVY